MKTTITKRIIRQTFGKILLTTITFVLLTMTSYAQTVSKVDRGQAAVSEETTVSNGIERDKISIGVGLGFDYCGIGAGLIAYPQKNIGVFANAGFFLAGPSYLVGLKGRYVTKSKIDPYITFMYGYSGSVSVMDDMGDIDNSKNKIFTSPNFGAGIDVHLTSSIYLTTGINTILNTSDIKDYRDELEEEGYDFSNSILLPFGFSFGVKWVLF